MCKTTGLCCGSESLTLTLVCCVLCPAAQVNTEIVAIQRVITPAGEAQLKDLIQDHAVKTGSKKAAVLLADWANAKAKFWQIVPPGEGPRGIAFMLLGLYNRALGFGGVGFWGSNRAFAMMGLHGWCTGLQLVSGL